MMLTEALPTYNDFDPRTTPWIGGDLISGDCLSGVIVKLPSPGAFNGHRLFVQTSVGVIGIHATAKRGHSLLEHFLEDFSVGDRITIRYHGKRPTQDGARTYRHYEVTHD